MTPPVIDLTHIREAARGVARAARFTQKLDRHG